MIPQVTLEGEFVRLEPLTLDHVERLAAVGLEPELWQWLPYVVETIDQMRAYVSKALAQQQAGLELPFATVLRKSGQVIGSTRYMDIALAHRRLEIGCTWLSSAYQRTAANTEAKLLMLTHAFEALGIQKVVLKTDALNERSRVAILRLGAVEEGVLRRHSIAENGRMRDMVHYSILNGEWPEVKRRLMNTIEV